MYTVKYKNDYKMLGVSVTEYGLSAPVCLLLIVISKVDGTFHSSSKTNNSTIYPATLTGIIIGGIVALIIIIVLGLIIVQICCKGKQRRDHRRIVATGGRNVADAEGVNPFFPNPMPPPAYDSLYPTPTDGTQSLRNLPPILPCSPPPSYNQATTTHM